MPLGETALFVLGLVHWLTTALYGGSLTAFAALLAMRHRLSPLRPEDVMRTFRAWGAGLGLPMVRAPFPWAQSAEVPRLGEGNLAILGALGLPASLLHAATGGL